MLKFKSVSKVLATLAITSIVFVTACKKEENTESVLTEDKKAELAQKTVKASLYFTNAFSNATWATTKANGLKSNEPVLEVRGVCADPTVVPADLFTFPKTVTLDFGNGCTDNEGLTRAGKMTLNVGKFWEANATIKASFENFAEGRTKLNGSYSIENKTVSGVEILSFAADNIVYTDENGQITSYTIRQSHKQIEGMRTLNQRDDVYEITTFMTSTFADGTKTSWESTTPLIKANNCRWIRKGTGTIKMNNEVSTIDFGNGTCDDEATLTTNGISKIIKL